MEEPKDKRTKAYKDWKAYNEQMKNKQALIVSEIMESDENLGLYDSKINQEKESKGLGDTIAKITKVNRNR